jgi:hypothetical protein
MKPTTVNQAVHRIRQLLQQALTERPALRHKETSP